MRDAAARSAEARALADALDAYCARYGLATSRVGEHLFKGARSGISLLRHRKRPTERLLARIRQFLAEPPPSGLHRRPCGGARKRRDCSTGEWLAVQVEALIAEHNLSPRSVAQHLFNSPNTLKRLRTMKPQKRTVERVLAFLRAPDIEAMRKPVARASKPPLVPVAPVVSRPRLPLTFEQQLALVASGKASIVEKVRIPERQFDRSLTGNAWML